DASIFNLLEKLRKEHTDNLAITSAVYAEFYFGLMPLEIEKREKEINSIEHYNILDFDKHSAAKFAEIRYKLKKTGQPIPIFDMITAAICLRHGSTLVTNDSHYKNVEGLKIEFIGNA
ncbi:MAG TPA: type II toxin-antitoxin system VapC family toxin, partial [archaeon]|nr:type II toxin-antitoxin system VapC family toxin [archaeon]